MAAAQELKLTVRKHRSRDFVLDATVLGDPADTAAMQQQLRDLLTADHWDEARFGEFEMEIRAANGSQLGTVTAGG